MTSDNSKPPKELKTLVPLPGYFPDLDGLRAVAVLIVVGYHAGLTSISGGFTGVDIFFVLSGFFITLQIAKDIGASRFSIAKFYERRIRRILPALFFVCFITYIVATIIMVPDDLRGFQRSLLAALLFVANIFFWQDISYFAQDASTKPLLHLWSLAVEEQFYLFFPIALAIIARFGPRITFLFLATVAFVSFFASAALTPVYPAASFFLLPTRAWELLLGSLVALTPRFELKLYARHILSVTGLVLIAVSVFYIGPNDDFPGWLAILPTSASVLLILASLGGGGVGNKLLAITPMVWIGLISYSLYLWHWPILVFARYISNGELSAAVAMVCVALSFALAAFSLRFVEKPFRRPQSKLSGLQVSVFALTGAGVLAAGATAVLATDGMPQRFSPAAARYIEAGERLKVAECFDLDPEAAASRPVCHLGDKTAPTKVVVWGDSHAYRLATNIDQMGSEQSFDALLLTRGSCPPLQGVTYGRTPFAGLPLGGESAACRKFSERAYAKILASDPDLVILSARWSNYAEGTEADSPKSFNSLSDSDTFSRSSAENRQVFRRSLKRTINALRSNGARVLIVGPVPNLGIDAPRAFAIAEQWNMEFPTGPSLAEFYLKENSALTSLAEADFLPGVSVYYPHRILCASGRCAISNDGHSLYMDDNHLNDFGNLLIHPSFAASVRSSYVSPRRERHSQ